MSRRRLINLVEWRRAWEGGYGRRQFDLLAALIHWDEGRLMELSQALADARGING